MRGYKKFSFRNKWHVFSFFFKKRILNFKRTKWKKIKSKIFYSIRQSNIYKKRLISVKFCRFLNNLKFLKLKFKGVKGAPTFQAVVFLKNLKNFLVSKKFKKLKRNLKFKLKFYFKKPFYQKYSYFQKCFSLFFFPFTTIRISSRQHIRSRFFFKNMLLSKASVLKYYYGCFPVQYFKNQNLTKVYKKDLAITYIKPELRLDILLWRLKFFRSPYLAKFAFQKNLIRINSFARVLSTFNSQLFKRTLSGGDTICLSSQVVYSYKSNLSSVVNSFYLPSFVELDYYANSIILLKDLNLNFKDLNSALKEPLNFYQFRNFLSK